MTYVVGEACINCKHTTCVDVCPTEAFREGPNFIVIDPDHCVDCDICVPECPEEAIFSEDDIPHGQEAFLDLNAKLSQEWPIIQEAKEPMSDYDTWSNIADKIHLLQAK